MQDIIARIKRSPLFFIILILLLVIIGLKIKHDMSQTLTSPFYYPILYIMEKFHWAPSPITLIGLYFVWLIGGFVTGLRSAYQSENGIVGNAKRKISILFLAMIVILFLAFFFFNASNASPYQGVLQTVLSVVTGSPFLGYWGGIVSYYVYQFFGRANKEN